MLNIGGGELLIILLVALIFLGPTRLPEVARQVGQTLTTLRGLARGFQAEMEAAARPDPLTAPQATPEANADEAATATTAEAESAASESAGEDAADAAGDSEAEPTADGEAGESSDDASDEASDAAPGAGGDTTSQPIPTIAPFSSSDDLAAASAQDASIDRNGDAPDDGDAPSTSVPATDPSALAEAARQRSAEAAGSDGAVPEVAKGGPVDLTVDSVESAADVTDAPDATEEAADADGEDTA